ncbi:hypothetical protein EV421DRAFT_452216 [Armillaria borealis]|uniref:MYND-type domain-containing protein n=1 Tax=Armillaria borealis TaxID=47425 RepID=A0AA39N298_9AGAR|nr:hypothetical protein EV421DRAFT_452216 [Armillaria borealis]
MHRHQPRSCSNCSKSEAKSLTRFQMCSQCKIARYCNQQCQISNWHIHKPVCKSIVKSRAAAQELDEYVSSEPPIPGTHSTVPFSAIGPIHDKWTQTYRALMSVSLTTALGYRDAPPSGVVNDVPTPVFLVNLVVIPNITPTTKARAAFRVKDVHILSLDEFRNVAADESHALHSHYYPKLLEDYDLRFTPLSRSKRISRTAMVVEEVYYHSGSHTYINVKNWYFTDNPSRDYSHQWKPDNWLEYLKTTVAAGKGWEHGCVHS